jgi:hypothetical protein
MAQSIGPALIDEFSVRVPDFDAKQGVIRPAFRLVDVHLVGHHVEVADENNWHL